MPYFWAKNLLTLMCKTQLVALSEVANSNGLAINEYTNTTALIECPYSETYNEISNKNKES